MLPSAECPEHQKLLERYLAALRAYGQMVPSMDVFSTRREFEEAYERAEEERIALIRARFDLRHHIERHGCAVKEAEEEEAPT